MIKLNKLTHLLFLVLLATFFVSCEKKSQITYKVRNLTLNPIKVVTTNIQHNHATETFMIAINEEATIAVNEQGSKSITNYKETDSMLRDFSKIEVYKNDTLTTKVNFRLTDRWIYFENDRHSADYLLIVRVEDI